MNIKRVNYQESEEDELEVESEVDELEVEDQESSIEGAPKSKEGGLKDSEVGEEGDGAGG